MLLPSHGSSERRSITLSMYLIVVAHSVASRMRYSDANMSITLGPSSRTDSAA